MRLYSLVFRSAILITGCYLLVGYGCAAPGGKKSGQDAVTSASYKEKQDKSEGRFQFLQQSPNCSDLDVIPPGQDAPAFRLLLPEAIINAEGKVVTGGIHTMPGMWKHRDTYSRSELTTRDDKFKINIRMEPRGREMTLRMEVINISNETIEQPRVDICMNFDHLPGKPGWSNPDVIPASVPLKRSTQADYWFEKITPKNLKAMDKEGWVAMHPWPKHPTTDGGSYKSFKPSETDEYRVCAVSSLDNKQLYYMAWDAPCRYCTPCRENACMHLWPLLADRLGPGEQAGIRGIIGVYDGRRDDLAQHVRDFLRLWSFDDCSTVATDGSNWTELFNGRDLTGFRSMGPMAETTWQVVGALQAIEKDGKGRLAASPGKGVLVNGPDGNTFDLVTAQSFTDCELHVEFMVAKESNSGIFFQGKYEIQILDSYGKPEAKPNDCGGIYYRWVFEDNKDGHAPRVNASKPPGEWQSFDVIFRASRFDDKGNKIANARFIKVVHNGILIHENVELASQTRMCLFGPEPPCGPLMLQGDHGPVAFRNLKIRRLNLD